ncbi:MAG: hypothetical protein GY696_14410 [Gammaproteobacteria bacterium]|nr:hypothetical protein [Gammaproteobacteria bacterium]
MAKEKHMTMKELMENQKKKDPSEVPAGAKETQKPLMPAQIDKAKTLRTGERWMAMEELNAQNKKDATKIPSGVKEGEKQGPDKKPPPKARPPAERPPPEAMPRQAAQKESTPTRNAEVKYYDDIGTPPVGKAMPGQAAQKAPTPTRIAEVKRRCWHSSRHPSSQILRLKAQNSLIFCFLTNTVKF